MAIEVWENPKSRSLDWNKSYKLLFFARGSADPAAILAAVDSYITSANVPVIYVINRKTVEPLTASDHSDMFCSWSCTWECTPIEYVLPQPIEPGETRLSFSTGGGSMHLTQSISTFDKVGGMDFNRLINVSENGVNGVDVAAPQSRFSFTRVKDFDDVMGDYGKSVLSLTGTVNDSNFKGYEAYCVLFLGASGSSPRDGADFTMTFEFAYQPPEFDLVVGDLDVAYKPGWHYLWHFDKKVQKTAGGVSYFVMEPVAAFVEQVLRETDFSILDI